VNEDRICDVALMASSITVYQNKTVPVIEIDIFLLVT
jgi:hypothetical protein